MRPRYLITTYSSSLTLGSAKTNCRFSFPNKEILFIILFVHFEHVKHIAVTNYSNFMHIQIVTQVILGIHMDEEMAKEMVDNFEILNDNFFCLPIDFPGSGLDKVSHIRFLL